MWSEHRKLRLTRRSSTAILRERAHETRLFSRRSGVPQHHLHQAPTEAPEREVTLLGTRSGHSLGGGLGTDEGGASLPGLGGGARPSSTGQGRPAVLSCRLGRIRLLLRCSHPRGHPRHTVSGCCFISPEPVPFTRSHGAASRALQGPASPPRRLGCATGPSPATSGCPASGPHPLSHVLSPALSATKAKHSGLQRHLRTPGPQHPAENHLVKG